MGQTVTLSHGQDSSIHGQTTHPGTWQTEPATQNGAGGRGYAFCRLSGRAEALSDRLSTICIFLRCRRWRGFSDARVHRAVRDFTSGMAGLGAGQILMGPLSDKYGRKPLSCLSRWEYLLPARLHPFSRPAYGVLLMEIRPGIGAAGGYFLARTGSSRHLRRAPFQQKMMALIGASTVLLWRAHRCSEDSAAKYFRMEANPSDFAALLSFFCSSPASASLSPFRAPQARSGKNGTDFPRIWPAAPQTSDSMTQRQPQRDRSRLLFAYIPSSAVHHAGHPWLFRRWRSDASWGVNAPSRPPDRWSPARFRSSAMRRGGCWILICQRWVIISLLVIHDFGHLKYRCCLIPLALGMIFTVGNTVHERGPHSRDERRRPYWEWSASYSAR